MKPWALVTWHGIHGDVGLEGDRLLPIPGDQEDSQECYEAPEGGEGITEMPGKAEHTTFPVAPYRIQSCSSGTAKAEFQGTVPAEPP